MIIAEDGCHFILKFLEDVKLDQTYYNIIIKKLDYEKRETVGSLSINGTL